MKKLLMKSLKKIKYWFFDLFLDGIYWYGKLEAINKLLYFYKDSRTVYILRKFGAKVGENVGILPPLIIHSHNKNNDYGNIKIGNNCRIGRGTLFDLASEIVINDNVVISMGVTLLTHMDVGTSPLSLQTKFIRHSKVKIENGAYLGANVTVLCGVTIGENAIVGAGAVVTKNIEQFSIVAGVPAKKIAKAKT
ncbi:MAG: acyltransferase, partial [Candidatus Hodarchaeota archaeon]